MGLLPHDYTLSHQPPLPLHFLNSFFFFSKLKKKKKCKKNLT